MHKQLTSVLATAATVVTSLLITAGTSHAGSASKSSSSDATFSNVAVSEQRTAGPADTFIVETDGPIEAWLCVTRIGGQVDCFWVADRR